MKRVGLNNPTFTFITMNILILSIIIIILGIILICFGVKKIKQANEIKIQKIHQQHEEELLDQKINALSFKIEELREVQKEKNKDIENLNLKIRLKRQQAEKDYTIEKQILSNELKQFKKVTKEAANNYIDTLQKDYESAEAAHKKHIAGLQAEYSKAAADLQVLKDTRKAAYEALLKQQEVKENKENYSLHPSKNDLEDIYTLEHIKLSLHKPRILSMLIWQTYWQPLAKKQFPIILQDKTKTGIYKITNIQNDQCYIGQSLNIYKRWCDHCKAGLGIDAPVGNKLYQSMQKTGLQNFTFELLCECPKQELDEKEKYFIELYQSDLYGFNGTKGNKKQ